MPHPVVTYLAAPRAWEFTIAGRQITKYECLVASLKLLGRFAPPWPVVVFHEDLGDADKRELDAALGREIRHEPVDFSGHEAEHVAGGPYGGRVDTYGYRMMCRFFCGVMQAHPALADATHYLRMDDDSYLLDTIPDAAIERMTSFDYTWLAGCDDERPDIRDFATGFLASKGLTVTAPPAPRVPYNNYHTASLRLWRDPVVAEFMSLAQDKCLTDCWNDAPVHRELLRQFIPALGYTTHFETEVMYRHNQHCCHKRPHNDLCKDGTAGQYQWGPPILT